jgi:hypothetical protein
MFLLASNETVESWKPITWCAPAAEGPAGDPVTHSKQKCPAKIKKIEEGLRVRA